LALLTFPYHNVYGVTVAVGNAAAAGLQVALLPLSIARLVGANQTDQVPAYVKSTMATAAAAIPGIVKAIQAEIQYDLNLFSQLGGGGSMLRAAATDTVSTASTGGATLLALLTFPYHNVLGVTVGFTNAAAAALQVVLLPVSVASLVGANQTDQVPAYVKSTLANAAAAIPGIFKAIQAEIEYDRNLFSQLGSGLATATATATAAPKADSRLVNVSVAATAKVEADTHATKPEETQKTEADTDASAAVAENAGTTKKRDDDETASETKVSTTESVKKTPKKVTDDATDAGGDTPQGDSGPHATTPSAGDAASTASKGSTASDAAPTGKSGADSTQSEK
jgi:hypothetical protein